MYLTYGNYTFPTGEARISIDKSVRYSPRGTKEVVVETWTISGTLINDGEYANTLAVNELQAAFSLNNQDLILHHTDGTASTHYMTLGQATGGIRVTSLSFPEWKGGQFATGRTYQITVEGLFPNTANQILSYRESIAFIGNGGPRYAYIELINGAPQRQTVSQQTLFRATQSGSAISQGGYITFPAPLWPQYEDGEARNQSTSGGELVGGVLTNFGIQWSYQFTSDVPLFGQPTIY